MPLKVNASAILLAIVIVLVLVIVVQGTHYHRQRRAAQAGPGPTVQIRGRRYNPSALFAIPPRAADDKYNGFPTPEKYAEAEREAWAASEQQGSMGTYNPEQGDMQSHAPQPALDYNSLITGAVADNSMQEKHGNWVKEVQPWSKTLLMVDNMDEAMEQSVHRIGLTRYNLQPIETINPLQHIEGSDLFKDNKTFRFQG